MIADEHGSGAAGDHFAKTGRERPGVERMEKLAVREPETFVAYYANDIVELVSSAGSARTTRSPRRSTSSTRAARRRRFTATTTWGS